MNEELRASLLAKRQAIDPEKLEALSLKISQKLSSSGFFAPGKLSGTRVALYRPMRGEVSPLSLEKWLWREGARVHYPRIEHRGDKLMHFAEVPESGASDLVWVPGPYGIDEPHSRFEAAQSGLMDVILVPGLAFGISGERIGMGGGYYDRLLAKETQALRVAFCLDFQVFPKLPQNPWDQSVHWILSEVREIRSPAMLEWRTRRGFV